MTSEPSGIFREEALAAQDTGRQRGGDVLRVAPEWSNWAYWLLVLVALAGLAYAAVGTVPEYAEGPAVVCLYHSIFLRAPQEGIVKVVSWKPGELMKPHECLVQLECLEASGARRYESIRAPCKGKVGTVCVKPGRYVAAGEIVATFSPEGPKPQESQDPRRPQVVAILPGRYRAHIHPGMCLRLEPAGHRYTYERLVVREVWEEVVGPETIRGYLGGETAEVLPVSGPAVLVQGDLADTTFFSQGRPYNYFHGMQGTVRVYIRSEPILLKLVPQLKALFGGRDG